MKIIITGLKKLPKAVDGMGYTPGQGVPQATTALKFPSFQESLNMVSGKSCPDGQQKNPLTGMCEPKPNFGVSQNPSLSFNPGEGFVKNPFTNKYEQPTGVGFDVTTTTTKNPSNISSIASKISGTIDTAIALGSVWSNYRSNKEAEENASKIKREAYSAPIDYTTDRGTWNPLTGKFNDQLQSPVNQGMTTNNFYPLRTGAYGGELSDIMATNMPAMSIGEMTPVSISAPRPMPEQQSSSQLDHLYIGATEPGVSKNVKSSTDSNTNIPHWDSNNPGNIHYGSFAQKYGASVGRNDVGGKIAVFPDMQTGLQAQEDLLFSPSYSNLTISQARKRWVGSDNQSIKAIVNAMGGDKKLADLSEPERKKLISEFIKWEDRKVYEGLKQKGLIMKHGGSVNSNNMKIVITGGPNKKMAYGGQSGYGFDLGQRNTYSAMSQDVYETPSKTIQPVSREEANIEAEKGETVYGDLNKDGQNEHMVIGGKRHSQGGTPLNVPEGSFIFSDTKKMKIKDPEVLKFFGVKSKSGGITPAEIAKKYDINKYRAILEDPYTDPVKKRTAELMINNCEKKLGYLALIQESMKGFPQGIPEIAEKVMGQNAQETNPGGPEPNGIQEYPTSQPSIQQGAAEETEEGMQGQNPEEEGMEQPPMQRWGGMYEMGGGYGNTDMSSSYIPEDLGSMAYGGYMPIYADGGGNREFDRVAGIKVTKNSQGTLVQFPNGHSTFIFPNGRVKRTSADGKVTMDNLTDDDIIGVQKTPKGGYEIKYNDGQKQVYYNNDREMTTFRGGNKSMYSINPKTGEFTLDETPSENNRNSTFYEDYSKYKIKKYPDRIDITDNYGDRKIIYNNGRVQVFYKDGTSEMRDLRKNDVADVKKTPQGGYEVSYALGDKNTYYNNNRTMYTDVNGKTEMTTYDPLTGKTTLDSEKQTTPAATNTQRASSTQTTPPPSQTANSSSGQASATPGDNNQIVPWKGDIVENKANASKFSKQEWADKLKAAGYTGPLTNEAVQKWLYTQPQSKAVIDQLHQQYGMPKKGMFDKILGYRWDSALQALNNPPQIKFTPGPDQPPVEEQQPQEPQSGTKWFCTPSGVMPMATNMAPENKGITYYNSKAEAEAACSGVTQQTTSSYDTSTHPGEFTSSKSKTPTGWLTPDKVNYLTGLLNRSTITKQIPDYTRYEPIVPGVAFDDWLARAQARQSTYNKTADVIGKMMPGQNTAALLSSLQGTTGEGVSQDIADVNTKDIGYYNQNQLEKANMLNQAAMYNAGVSDKNMEGRIEANRQYNREMRDSNNSLAQLFDTGWKNAADTYNINETSPYNYINPVTGRMVFKDDNARAAFMNAIQTGQTPGAGGMNQNQKWQLFQEYAKNPLTTPELAYKMAFGDNNSGYTQQYNYATDVKKNKTVTKTPNNKYGGKVKNPYLKKK